MRRIKMAGLAALLVLGAAGCSSLLDVEIPGRVPEEALDNANLSVTLVNGALGEFECAYSQYVATTGILSGEYLVSGLTIGSNIWGWRGEVELKATPGSCTSASGNYGYYNPLQRSRFLADDGIKRIEGFADASVPTKTALLAQLYAYSGYSYTLLGEGFCNMAIDEGPLMTRAQVFAVAEEKFTKAIALATTANDAAILNMSRVGRARVRLNLGKKTEAAADVDAVPATFVRNAGYSIAVARRENKVYNASIVSRDLSVAPAYRNLTVGAVPDSRMVVTDAKRNGSDGVTPQWDQTKFTAKTSPIIIASYKEAQLIIAEARGGQAAVDALNRLRTRANLPQLSAAEIANINQTIIEERRRELFSEGQRYNDMIRLNIPFPSGVNHKNQTYGNISCLPLPDVETLNNPNINK